MTAPQLMRAVLAALSVPRTFEKGLFMARGEAAAPPLGPPPPPAAALRKAFDVTFVDASGYLNLMQDVSRSSLQHVSQPSRLYHFCQICLPVVPSKRVPACCHPPLATVLQGSSAC